MPDVGCISVTFAHRDWSVTQQVQYDEEIGDGSDVFPEALAMVLARALLPRELAMLAATVNEMATFHGFCERSGNLPEMPLPLMNEITCAAESFVAAADRLVMAWAAFDAQRKVTSQEHENN